jgi:hypothetical protein
MEATQMKATQSKSSYLHRFGGDDEGNTDGDNTDRTDGDVGEGDGDSSKM